MSFLITTGKTITLLAWGLMVYNLIMPFGGNISLVLNILLGITIMMHLLQTLMFHSAFSKLLPLTGKDYRHAFIYGVFALLQYRHYVLAKMSSK